MAHFYHVSALKPTAVISSCTGRFTGPDDLNLIIAKNSHLEINEVTAEGLKLVKEVPIFGKIVGIRIFRPKTRATDSIVVITHKAWAAIIECNKNSDGSLEFVTVASGSFEEATALKGEKGFDVLVDPNCTVLLIRFYMGLIKVIPLTPLDVKTGECACLRSYTIRTEEYFVINIAFLHVYAQPTFAIMYEDENGLHIKAYELGSVEKGLTQVAWHATSIQPDSALLIGVPKPYGGAVVVGLQAVCYHSKDGHYVAQVIPQTKQSAIQCLSMVDDLRYLLGDLAGRLYMVHLMCGAGEESSSTNIAGGCGPGGSALSRITAVRVELLGETSIPQSICYLDNGIIFVGSSLGDSQLVRLNPQADEKGSFVSVLENMMNIGPVIDMVMVDRDKQGQNQMITASGAFKEGSLRVIRSGIGIHEHASIDQELIKAIWCFKCFGSEDFDDTIILSVVGQTQVLALNQDDIEPLELDGLDTNRQTYHCSLVCPGQLIQVTLDSVRLIGVGEKGGGLLDSWKPASGRSVSQCNSWGDQVVAASGPDLYYLRVEEGKLVQVSHHHLDHEVACLDLTPIQPPSTKTLEPHSSQPLQSKLVAVGLWLDFSVLLLSLPDLKPLLKEPLNCSVIPRSLLLAQLDDTPRLFVAMGDGTLIYYLLDVNTGTLRDCKRANVGTGPMFLRQWRSQSKNSVFVCSDHPCIIYSTNNKLVFANVNLKEVTYMCPLNSSFYHDCLALVSSSCLIFGSVDDIQKLHVRTIPLEETPKRLAVQEETGNLGLITFRKEVMQEGSFVPVRPSVSVSAKPTKTHSNPPKIVPGSNIQPGVFREREDLEVSSFLLLDLSSLEVLAAHSFYSTSSCSETALSLTSCRLTGIADPCFVVGTAFLIDDETEPKAGRLTVFCWRDECRLEVIVEHEVNGAPYAVLEYNGRLLAAINSSVRLFEYKDNILKTVCGHYEHVLCLYLQRKGDFVVVGDLMRSVSLLLYKASINGFEVIASHRSPRWTSAITILDDDHFLASENDFNVYVVAEDTEEGSGGTDEKRRLDDCAYMHTGEYINKFVHGNLIMQTTAEGGLAVSSPLMYGGVNGSLGMICQISSGLYTFLLEIQRRLTRLVSSVGNLSHEAWRAFKTDKMTKVAENFIDGDLIETFLDLGLEDKERILADSIKLPSELCDSSNTRKDDCSVEDLVKVIEELSRLH